MQYTIRGLQKKSADWVIAELEGLDGTNARDVSINRTNKDGSAIQFAGFEDFAIGTVLEGNLWTSPSGKQALYPPKPRPAAYAARSGGGAAAIKEAMATKKADINEFQNKKHEAIQIAGAFRDATLITLASLKDRPFPTDEEFKEEWTKWVKYFLDLHEQPFI